MIMMKKKKEFHQNTNRLHYGERYEGGGTGMRVELTQIPIWLNAASSSAINPVTYFMHYKTVIDVLIDTQKMFFGKPSEL